jgi:hypothetical protein
MKIYTASYWEPEVHGAGRKIGISPSKPNNLLEEAGYDCELCHDWLSPGDTNWDYHKAKREARDEEDIKKAGETFVSDYKKRLEQFKESTIAEAKVTGKTVFEVIGLEEGDTLLSWERGGHLTFRVHTAQCLRELGYEVEER